MRRVYLLSSQLMFSQGVEVLLRGQTGLEIVGRETDMAKGLNQILALQPEVVILDSKDLASAPTAILANILEELPSARVILLNLENDQMRVYRGEQRNAQGVSDLMEVIAESPF